MVVKLGINCVLKLIIFRKFLIFVGVVGWFDLSIVWIFFFVGLILYFDIRSFMKIILFILNWYFWGLRVRFFFCNCCNILWRFLLCFLLFLLCIIKLLVMFWILLILEIICFIICWYFLGVEFILKFSFLYLNNLLCVVNVVMFLEFLFSLIWWNFR